MSSRSALHQERWIFFLKAKVFILLCSVVCVRVQSVCVCVCVHVQSVCTCVCVCVVCVCLCMYVTACCPCQLMDVVQVGLECPHHHPGHGTTPHTRH